MLTNRELRIFIAALTYRTQCSRRGIILRESVEKSCAKLELMLEMTLTPEQRHRVCRWVEEVL